MGKQLEESNCARRSAPERRHIQGKIKDAEDEQEEGEENAGENGKEKS
jgi:hypothetical protein